MLKFLLKKIIIFYNKQLKISKKVVIWWPGAHRVLFVWGAGALQALFIWVQECSGNSYNFIWLSESFGHSKKECPERSGSSNEEYPVCSGTSNNDIFADFQLFIVKNCDFFPRKFQQKKQKAYPSFSFRYKLQANR